MKALYIPVAILFSLLVMSLLGSAYVQNRTDIWIASVEEISESLPGEHWYELESTLLAVHKGWEDSQKLFHLILDHQDLDEAEKYFSGALAACREQDSIEFRIHLAQLTAQFTFLGDTQELSLKNIL